MIRREETGLKIKSAAFCMDRKGAKTNTGIFRSWKFTGKRKLANQVSNFSDTDITFAAVSWVDSELPEVVSAPPLDQKQGEGEEVWGRTDGTRYETSKTLENKTNAPWEFSTKKRMWWQTPQYLQGIYFSHCPYLTFCSLWQKYQITLCKRVYCNLIPNFYTGWRKTLRWNKMSSYSL